MKFFFLFLLFFSIATISVANDGRCHCGDCRNADNREGAMYFQRAFMLSENSLALLFDCGRIREVGARNVVIHWQLPVKEKMYAVWTKNTSFMGDNTRLDVYLHSVKYLEDGEASKSKVGRSFHSRGKWKVLE